MVCKMVAIGKNVGLNVSVTKHAKTLTIKPSIHIFFFGRIIVDVSVSAAQTNEYLTTKTVVK